MRLEAHASRYKGKLANGLESSPLSWLEKVATKLVVS